jgi:dTDP-glucose 4,6-dehydratase
MADNPLSADLEDILDRTRPLWEELRGSRVFVTGGTGFTGCWLLESFAWVNQRLGLGAKMLVLTRNVERFRKKAPHLATHSDIQFHAGNLGNFDFPAGSFSHVVHAGTEWPAGPSDEEHETMRKAIVQGTRHALDFAASCGAKKFLMVGSGAVYGPQPPDMTHIAEDYAGTGDVSVKRTPYGEAKRLSELLCAEYSLPYGIETKIDRGFAFVGPYLPLDMNFAIGNFIRDAMAGGPIKIGGDGTPFRSYLYAGDLATWLWTILFRGASNRPYNVGSNQALSIAETAEAVASAFGGKIRIEIAKKPLCGQVPQRYIPDINRAVSELHLDQWTQLEDGIRATVKWHRQNRI